VRNTDPLKVINCMPAKYIHIVSIVFRLGGLSWAFVRLLRVPVDQKQEGFCWLSIIRMSRRDCSICSFAVSSNVRVSTPPLISAATVGTGNEVARPAPALSAPGSELRSLMLIKTEKIASIRS
jgi:hypothetical protein